MPKTAINPVVHFEMPAEDTKRMADFYSETFGWNTRQLGPEMGNYVLAATGETDENGRPRHVGMINGGFYAKKDDWPAQHPSVVIAVQDVKESIKKVTENGGEILGCAENSEEGSRVFLHPPGEQAQSFCRYNKHFAPVFPAKIAPRQPRQAYPLFQA